MNANYEDEFYKNIIYKKNAVEELCPLLQDLKIQKVFFIASKTAYQKFGSFVVNQINRAGKFFKFKFVSSVLDENNFEKLINEMSDCGIIVALGGGGVCDIAKLLSQKTNKQFIMIVSTPTTTAYFTDYAYVFEGVVAKRVKCSYAFKVLIDENFIISSNLEIIDCGKSFVASHYELLFNLQAEKLIFSKNEAEPNLKFVLAKLKDNIEYLKSDFEDSKLVLMDILIDLAYVLKNCNSGHFSFLHLAFLLKKSGAVKGVSFGKICLFASRIILEINKKYLSLKKLQVFCLPDFERLSNSLKFFKLNSNYVSFVNIKKIIENKQFFLKLNAVKNQMLCLVDFAIEQTDEFFEKVFCAQIDFVSFFKCLNIMPYVYSCAVLINAVCSSGLINY